MIPETSFLAVRYHKVQEIGDYIEGKTADFWFHKKEGAETASAPQAYTTQDIPVSSSPSRREEAFSVVPDITQRVEQHN
ncbi:MAG: hypothetical protein CVV55_06345 [Synergistetes bacterium HGW-Synergistetes-2]|jgi:hypothetical protein|nr:MAG: hypothetical protein CVV55_06345 [Synergistetes bacterium HGW-Synergistetes-2]